MSTGATLDLPDELMVDWGNTPAGSTASFYWPQLNAADVVALAGKIYGSHLLSVADANTVKCTVTKGVTYIPIALASGVNFAGLLTIDLPKTVRYGQEFNIVLRRVSTIQVDTEPVPRIEARPTHRTHSLPPREHQPRPGGLNEAGPVPPSNPAPPTPEISTWRQIAGAFQVRIPVTTSAVMLPIEENTLAVLKWRLEQISPVNRWYPVLDAMSHWSLGEWLGWGAIRGRYRPLWAAYRPPAASTAVAIPRVVRCMNTPARSRG